MRTLITLAVLALAGSPLAAQEAPTLDSIRTELVRSRGFIRGAETQLTKTLDLLDDYIAAQEADTVATEPPDTTTTDPDPGPEPVEGDLYSTDFEEYSVGDRLRGTGGGGFQWLSGPGDTNGSYVQVSDAVARSGSHSIVFPYGPTEPNGNSHWWSEQNFNLGQNVQELWIEFYLWFPEDYQHENIDGSSDNNKLLALWADDYQSEPLLAYQLWSGATNDTSVVNISRSLGDDGVGYTQYPDHTINRGPMVYPGEGGGRGEWVQIRVHTRVADFGESTGLHRLWRNGELYVDVTDDAFYDPDGESSYLRRGYLLGYDNGRFADETRIYMDDVTFHLTPPGW